MRSDVSLAKDQYLLAVLLALGAAGRRRGSPRKSRSCLELAPPLVGLGGTAARRKHPGTTFITAHLGWMGNDLAKLGRLMDELGSRHGPG